MGGGRMVAAVHCGTAACLLVAQALGILGFHDTNLLVVQRLDDWFFTVIAFTM